MLFRLVRPVAVGLFVLAAACVLGCAGEESSDSAAPEAEATPGATGLPSTTPPPGALGAAPGAPGPGATLRDEYMAVQQRLNSLQQQAMQDTVLQQEYAALEATVEAQMKAADPKLEERRARMMELQGEMAAAQQAGEEEKLQELLEEGTSLQNLLRQTQEQTMALEDVQAAMTGFRDKVLAQMAKIDPEAPALVERANAIGEQLAAAGPPAPGAAPPAGAATPGATGE